MLVCEGGRVCGSERGRMGNWNWVCLEECTMHERWQLTHMGCVYGIKTYLGGISGCWDAVMRRDSLSNGAEQAGVSRRLLGTATTFLLALCMVWLTHGPL